MKTPSIFDYEEKTQEFLRPLNELLSLFDESIKNKVVCDPQYLHSVQTVLDYIQRHLHNLQPHHESVSDYLKSFLEKTALIAPTFSNKVQELIQQIDNVKNISAKHLINDDDSLEL